MFSCIITFEFFKILLAVIFIIVEGILSSSFLQHLLIVISYKSCITMCLFHYAYVLTTNKSRLTKKILHFNIVKTLLILIKERNKFGHFSNKGSKPFDIFFGYVVFLFGKEILRQRFFR